MNVVNIADYRDQVQDDRISAAELIKCINFLQKEAQKSGFIEIADLLDLANLAADELVSG